MDEIDEEQFSYFDLLPSNLVVKIFWYFDVKTLCLVISRVCQRWAVLYREKKCWPRSFAWNFDCALMTPPIPPPASHPLAQSVTHVEVSHTCLKFDAEEVLVFVSDVAAKFDNVKGFRFTCNRRSNVYSRTAARRLKAIVGNWPDLEELHDDDIYIAEETITQLSLLQNLRKVTLGEALSSEVVSSFLKVLRTWGKLEELHLPKKVFFNVDAEFNEFLDVVGRKLLTANFKGVNSSVAGFRAIPDKCPNIEKISISFSNSDSSVVSSVYVVQHLARMKLTNLTIGPVQKTDGLSCAFMNAFWMSAGFGFGHELQRPPQQSSHRIDPILRIPEMENITDLTLECGMDIQHSTFVAIARTCTNLVRMHLRDLYHSNISFDGLALVVNSCKNIQHLQMDIGLECINQLRSDRSLARAFLASDSLETLAVSDQHRVNVLRELLGERQEDLQIVKTVCVCDPRSSNPVTINGKPIPCIVLCE